MTGGNGAATTEHRQAIVIGGGQAGLAASYHLARRGVDHVVLDAGAAPGATWRRRWDSLRLFTPAAFDALPDMPFPEPAGALPTKDRMADYLVEYAQRNRSPVRYGTRVDSLDRDEGRLVATAGASRFVAGEVIVATGFLTVPLVPAFAGDLEPGITQLHSDAYRNPTSLPEGRVLLVGGGNSGVEIGLELAQAGRQTMLAGHTNFLPWIARKNPRLFFSLARRVLTLDTPIGRRMHARMGEHVSAPVIRVRPVELRRAGVVRVPRVTGVRDGRPMLADGQLLDVDAVVWCTGFRPAFDWIRLPVIGPSGLPRHERGRVAEQPGLSFLGLPFQSGFLSALVGGVGADAERIVEDVARRLGSSAATA